MATAAQQKANQANAQKSTGPRTAEGKTAASRNAFKHGLTAATTVLHFEDDVAYHEVRGSLYTQYRPATPQEYMLVDQLASAWWRTLRIRRFETDRLDLEIATARRENSIPALAHDDARRGLAARLADQPYESFRTFFRYDAAIERAFYRALNTLEKLQAARRRNEPRQPQQPEPENPQPQPEPEPEATEPQPPEPQPSKPELASFRNSAATVDPTADPAATPELTAARTRSLKARWKTPTSSLSSGPKPAIATGSKPSSSAIAAVSSASHTG